MQPYFRGKVSLWAFGAVGIMARTWAELGVFDKKPMEGKGRQDPEVSRHLQLKSGATTITAFYMHPYIWDIFGKSRIIHRPLKTNVLFIVI